MHANQKQMLDIANIVFVQILQYYSANIVFVQNASL